MTIVLTSLAEPETGVSKEEFMRHYKTVYAPHVDHYRQLDSGAKLGVSWVERWTSKKQVVNEDTGESEEKLVERSGMHTEHVSMFDPERLWKVTERTVRRHGMAYIGYVPRKGSIVNDEHQGRRQRGKEADLLDMPEIIADFDTLGGSHKEANLPTGEQVLGWLAECPLGPPTFTVRSGGGYHGHWCFSKPVPVKEARELWDRLADWIETLSDTHGVHAGDEKVTRNPAILFRMAGTIHGKPGPNTDRRVQIVNETGRRYTPEDFLRLPVRIKRAIDQAARENRKLAQRTRRTSLGLSDDERQQTPWYRLDREVPVSEILERVFFMQHNGRTMTAPVEWLVDSGSYDGTAAHVSLYHDADDVERFTANGERTAAKLAIPAGRDSYGSFSLLVERFCGGSTRMAAAVARRYLDIDVEDFFTWLEDNVHGVKPDPEVLREPKPAVPAKPFEIDDDELERLARGAAPEKIEAKVISNCTPADASRIIDGKELPEGDGRTSWDIVVAALEGDAKRAGNLAQGVRTKSGWVDYLERIGKIAEINREWVVGKV